MMMRIIQAREREDKHTEDENDHLRHQVSKQPRKMLEEEEEQLIKVKHSRSVNVIFFVFSFIILTMHPVCTYMSAML